MNSVIVTAPGPIPTNSSNAQPAALLGVNGYAELDKSYIRAVRPVVPAHVHSPFPHLDLPIETY